jgi:hypothetical protein
MHGRHDNVLNDKTTVKSFEKSTIQVECDELDEAINERATDQLSRVIERLFQVWSS